MSKHLEKAVSNQQFREKLGFSSGVGKALGQALEKKPFWTLAGLGTAGGLMAGGLQGAVGSVNRVTGQPLDTTSYDINRALRPGIGGALNRVKADEILATGLTQNAGNIANEFINEAIRDVGKSYKKMINKPKQQAILKDLLESDEMLREADPEHVASLFNTMVDIAPKMTKYKDAVKSFLRQGVAHEGGLDPATLGELAKAEARLSGKGLGDR